MIMKNKRIPKNVKSEYYFLKRFNAAILGVYEMDFIYMRRSLSEGITFWLENHENYGGSKNE